HRAAGAGLDDHVADGHAALDAARAHRRSRELDCEAGTLHLDIDDAELARRMAAYQAPRSHGEGGGYQRLYVNHVLQADEGCDLDFLVGCRGAAVPRHSH
ncbi:dihydroxy-acid dehydratase, partial [Mycobacterium tuberculosis]|nr:dihydroxy-acid dehydratase [Mycobacterium tuberculosis]